MGQVREEKKGVTKERKERKERKEKVEGRRS
jgi:hypothetical protein